MTQLERVKKWLKEEWNNSVYSFNTADDRYYLFTFNKNNRTWDGMFWFWCDDDMAKQYKHILDLTTGKLVK